MLLFYIFWIVNIFECQHIPNSGGCSVIKASVVLVFGWIFESPKNDIK